MTISMRIGDCRYNDGVYCRGAEDERCAGCGWNPEVAERRKAKLYGKMKTDHSAPQDGERNDNDLEGEENT